MKLSEEERIIVTLPSMISLFQPSAILPKVTVLICLNQSNQAKVLLVIVKNVPVLLVFAKLLLEHARSCVRGVPCSRFLMS